MGEETLGRIRRATEERRSLLDFPSDRLLIGFETESVVAASAADVRRMLVGILVRIELICASSESSCIDRDALVGSGLARSPNVAARCWWARFLIGLSKGAADPKGSRIFANEICAGSVSGVCSITP